MAKVTRYYAVTHDSDDSEGWEARCIEKLLGAHDVTDVTEHVLGLAVAHTDVKAEIVDHLDN